VKQAIEPNPAGRSSDIPEGNRVTERHITQKHPVRKDEIPSIPPFSAVHAG
jgi:hypothetical protein